MHVMKSKDQKRKVNKMNKKQEIYNNISAILTMYEQGLANEKDLYNVLVEIQNRWEDTITAD